MVPDTEAKPAKKQIPIVWYLKLPSSPSERPYLVGCRCRSCGEVFLGRRHVCAKCFAIEQMEEVALSTTGELWVYTIVHQSAPGIEVPFIAGIVDLPEGVSVPCNIVGCEPKPEAVRMGMKVEMVVEKVREDNEGNEIMAYKFRPCKQGEDQQ